MSAIKLKSPMKLETAISRLKYAGGVHEVLANEAKQELEQIQAELAAKDAMLEVMEKKLSIAEGALMRIKTKVMEFEDRMNDTPPQLVPWWNLGDIAAAALKRLEGVK